MLLIETLTSEHLTQLECLEKEVFLKGAYSSQQLKEILEDNNYLKLGILENQKIVAYILILKGLDVNDLIKVGVINKYRRQHLATRLMEAVIELDKQKKILLEVNENNQQAISFYQKFNFKTNNVRKSYYNNNDNALIMVLNHKQKS